MDIGVKPMCKLGDYLKNKLLGYYKSTKLNLVCFFEHVDTMLNFIKCPLFHILYFFLLPEL